MLAAVVHVVGPFLGSKLPKGPALVITDFTLATGDSKPRWTWFCGTSLRHPRRLPGPTPSRGWLK